MATLLYALGMVLGIMIGSAIGQSFIQQHGLRKALPILALLTVLLGLAIGWSLNGELQAIESSSHT